MGRKHGLELPLGSWQISSFLFFSFLAAGVYTFYVPCVENRAAQISLIVVYTVLVCIVVALNLATSLKDPSDPGLYASTTAGEFYCAICQAGVGSNSKHCRTCDRCVDGFDHHCKWLNNCIGTSNYRSFFLLMAFTVGMCIVQLGWGLYLIARSFYDASNMEAIVHDAYYGMNFRGWQVALFIYILLLLLAIIMLGELFSFHIVLVSKGMTTYEFIIASKDDNPNAHQAPSSGGARAALCRSTKVADEAIMRQKPPSKPKVSLNPCKAVFAHKLEGDMRTWGKDGKKDKEKDSGLMFGKTLEIPPYPPPASQPLSDDSAAGVSGVTPGAYNHMGGHAPTELRSRTPRTPSPMELSSPRAPPAVRPPSASLAAVPHPSGPNQGDSGASNTEAGNDDTHLSSATLEAPGLSSVTLRPESAGSSGSRSLRGTSSGSGSIPGGPVRSPNRGQVSSPASLEAARSLDGSVSEKNTLEPSDDPALHPQPSQP